MVVLQIPGREILLCGRAVDDRKSCQLHRHDGMEFVPSSRIDGQIGTGMAMYDELTMYMVTADSTGEHFLLRLTLDPASHHVTKAEEVNGLYVRNQSPHGFMKRQLRGGLRGLCRLGEGFLCIAPRGSLGVGSTDQDCVVWIDRKTAEVFVLLQTELSDSVDMDVRPTGKNELDLFFWSYTLGLMHLRVRIVPSNGNNGGDDSSSNSSDSSERRFHCVDMSPITWVGPVNEDSRPPFGVTSLLFIDERRIVIVAPTPENTGSPDLLLLLTLSDEGKGAEGGRGEGGGRPAMVYRTKLLGSAPSNAEMMTLRMIAENKSSTLTTMPLSKMNKFKFVDGDDLEQEGLLQNIASTFVFDDQNAIDHEDFSNVKNMASASVVDTKTKTRSAARAVHFSPQSNGTINTANTTNTTINIATEAASTATTATTAPSPRSLRQKLRERLRRNSRRNSRERKQFTTDGNIGYSPNNVAKQVQQTQERIQRLRTSMSNEEEEELLLPPLPPPTPPSGSVEPLPPGTMLVLPPPPPPPTPPGGTGQTPKTPRSLPMEDDVEAMLYDMESSKKSPLLVNIADRQDALQATMRRRGLLKLGGF
jgi:hypothetical protein